MSKFGRDCYYICNQACFFSKLINLFIIKTFFTFSYNTSFLLLDRGFFEIFGPYGLSSIFEKAAKSISFMQSGLISHYTFLALLGLFVSLSFNLLSITFDFLPVFVYAMFLAFSLFFV